MNNRMLDLWAIMEAQNDMGIAKLLYDPSLPYHIYMPHMRATNVATAFRFLFLTASGLIQNISRI